MRTSRCRLRFLAEFRLWNIDGKMRQLQPRGKSREPTLILNCDDQLQFRIQRRPNRRSKNDGLKPSTCRPPTFGKVTSDRSILSTAASSVPMSNAPEFSALRGAAGRGAFAVLRCIEAADEVAE